MDKNIFVQSKYLSRIFKAKYVFMHNNSPFHLSKLTREYFEHKRFTGNNGMATVKFSSESIHKSMAYCEDEIIRSICNIIAKQTNKN